MRFLTASRLQLRARMPKPLIGINHCFDETANADFISFVATAYPDAVIEAGGVPIGFHLMSRKPDRAQVLDLLDGVVMVGGPDLDPRRDGFCLHHSITPMERRREESDRELIRDIADRQMPLLAIGVGMQLLNVHAGGTLSLHLPEDFPGAVPHVDKDAGGCRHKIRVTAGSLMERVYIDAETIVNSRHHMAVDDVAPGFKVTARCPDGITEAIERTKLDWFAVGTQFHPESGSLVDQLIFEEWMKGVKGE